MLKEEHSYFMYKVLHENASLYVMQFSHTTLGLETKVIPFLTGLNLGYTKVVVFLLVVIIYFFIYHQ